MADKKKKLTSDKIAESIFDASSIIAEAKMKNLAQDKTYKATVVGTSRAGEGLYSCKLDELVFTAVGGINEYKVDDIVQVNVPQDNWDNQKNIIGKGWVSESAGDATMPFDNFYVPGDEDFKNPFWSTSAETHLIANAAAKLITEVADAQEPPSAAEAVETSLAITNGTFLYDAYDRAYTTLGVRAKFCTKNLVNFPVLEGNYGLRLELFADTNSVLPLATYELNALNITGNVYALLDYTEFEALFKMDTSVLANLKSAKLSLFQNGQFYQMDGNTLESDFLRYDEGTFNENTNSRAKPSENISIKDIQLFWGYDARDFETDNLKLSCTSSLYYRIDEYSKTKDKTFKYNYIVKDKDNKIHEVYDAEPSLWYRIGTTDWVKSNASLDKKTQTFSQEITDTQMNSAANTISFKARIEKENYNDETGEKYEYIDSNVVTLQKKTDGTEKDTSDEQEPDTGEKKGGGSGGGGNANIINYITEAPDFKNDIEHPRADWYDALGIVLAQGQSDAIRDLPIYRVMHDGVNEVPGTREDLTGYSADITFYHLGPSLNGIITLNCSDPSVPLESRENQGSYVGQNQKDLLVITDNANHDLENKMIPPTSGTLYDGTQFPIGSSWSDGLSELRIITNAEKDKVIQINGYIYGTLGPKRVNGILLNHPFNYTISDQELFGIGCDHHNTMLTGWVGQNTSKGQMAGCNVSLGQNNTAHSAVNEDNDNYQAVVVAGRDNDVTGGFGTIVLGYQNTLKETSAVAQLAFTSSFMAGRENQGYNTAGCYLMGIQNTDIGVEGLSLGESFIFGRLNKKFSGPSQNGSSSNFILGESNVDYSNDNVLIYGYENHSNIFTEQYYKILNNGQLVTSWSPSLYVIEVTLYEKVISGESYIELYQDEEYQNPIDLTMGGGLYYCTLTKKLYGLPNGNYNQFYKIQHNNDTSDVRPQSLIIGEQNFSPYEVNKSYDCCIIGSQNYIKNEFGLTNSDMYKRPYIIGSQNIYNSIYNSGLKASSYIIGEKNLIKGEGQNRYILGSSNISFYSPSNHIIGINNISYQDSSCIIGENNKSYLNTDTFNNIQGNNNLIIKSNTNNIQGNNNIIGNSNYSYILGNKSQIGVENDTNSQQCYFQDEDNDKNYKLPLNFNFYTDWDENGQLELSQENPTNSNINQLVAKGTWSNDEEFTTIDTSSLVVFIGYWDNGSSPLPPDVYEYDLENSSYDPGPIIYTQGTFKAFVGDTLPQDREADVNYFINPNAGTNDYSLYLGTDNNPVIDEGQQPVGPAKFIVYYALDFDERSEYSVGAYVKYSDEYYKCIRYYDPTSASRMPPSYQTDNAYWIYTPNIGTPLFVGFDIIDYEGQTQYKNFWSFKSESSTPTQPAHWEKVADYDIPSESAAIIGQHDIGYGSDFFVTGKYNRNYGDNSIILGSANFNNSVSSFITGYGNINGDRTSVYTNQATEPAMSGISSYYYNPYDRKFYVNPHNGSVDPQTDTPIQGDPSAIYQDKTYVDGNNNSIINIPYKYNFTLGKWQIDLYNSRFTNDSLNYLSGVGNYIYGGTKFNYIQGVGNQIVDGARHCVIFGVNNKIGSGSSHVYITGEGHVLRNTTYNYDIHADYCNISGSYSDLVSLSGWSSPFAPIEVVGNGSENARSNARVLYKDGNETLAGILTVGAQPTSDNHVATKKYVDDAIAALPAGNPVSWNQIQTSTGATKIAEITIGQTTTDVYAPTGGGGGGSTVSWSQTQQTGTAIATITIDGVAQTVYAPTSGGAQFTDVTGTLTAGQTSITLSDVAILTTSTFDFYTDTFGVSPTAVSVAAGSITLTFAAQANNLGVKVRVW